MGGGQGEERGRVEKTEGPAVGRVLSNQSWVPFVPGMGKEKAFGKPGHACPGLKGPCVSYVQYNRGVLQGRAVGVGVSAGTGQGQAEAATVLLKALPQPVA